MCKCNNLALEKTSKVILFDGVCNLCNGFVQFVIERDIDNIFKFASLQSDYGQNFLKEHNFNTEKFDSFILVEGKGYKTKSTAALTIFSYLKGYSFTKPLIYLPKIIRDYVYTSVANNRYSLFGKSESCWLPTAELKEKFL